MSQKKLYENIDRDADNTSKAKDGRLKILPKNVFFSLKPKFFKISKYPLLTSAADARYAIVSALALVAYGAKKLKNASCCQKMYIFECDAYRYKGVIIFIILHKLHYKLIFSRNSKIDYHSLALAIEINFCAYDIDFFQ